MMGGIEQVARPDQQNAEMTSAEQGNVLTSLLAQQAAVARFAQRALAESRIEILLAEAASSVARVLETELVSVSQVEPGGDLRLVAGLGWRPGLVGQLRLPAGTGSQSGYTLKVGGPLVVEDLAREDRFAVVAELLEHGAVSGISARIGDGQQLFGVLSAFTHRRGRFSRDDASFLQSIAGVLAVALDRLRVEVELRHSRDELAAIVGTVRDGILVRGPDGRLLYANEPAAALNHYPSPEALVNATGADTDSRFALFDEEGNPIEIDELPSRVCLRTGRQTDERLVRVHWHDTGEERWQIIQASPVRAADGDTEKVVVAVRDITEERRALEARRFLAEALAVLSDVLDRTEQARQLARLCVPRIADYCSVDVLEPDGSILQLGEADTRQPAGSRGRGSGRRLERGEKTAGPAQVVRQGRSWFVSGASAHELGLTSWLSVPLMAREHPVGALTLGSRAGSRQLDRNDLSLAEELGARTGILLENARLFETAEARLAELDAVLTAMADAVLVFDADGRLQLTNRAADQLFEGEPPLTVARLGELVRARDGSSRETAGETSVRKAGPTSDVLADLEGELQLGSAGRWYELRGYRSRRVGELGDAHRPFVVVLRDVTERRAAQAARDAFMGVMSHELRTPITTIFGGSELLTRSLDEGQREEILRDIRNESERLARLVEDLLVMTRVERGGVEIGDEPVLMQRLIPKVVGALGARHAGLRVLTQLGENLPAVRSDPTYLEQVLRNLLTNAMRYGSGLENGVEISVADAGPEVEVRVLDRGPGLDEDDVEQLFELFYRSPSAHVVPGGAGIGLFVCRRLIEAMGGRTWARAREGGGAEFGFSLPVVELDPA